MTTSLCESTPGVKPLFYYRNTGGASIVGGPVYRGTADPRLVGSLLFGDYAKCVGWDSGNSRYGISTGCSGTTSLLALSPPFIPLTDTIDTEMSSNKLNRVTFSVCPQSECPYHKGQNSYVDARFYTFGEDNTGELYIGTTQTGVWRLVEPHLCGLIPAPSASSSLTPSGSFTPSRSPDASTSPSPGISPSSTSSNSRHPSTSASPSPSIAMSNSQTTTPSISLSDSPAPDPTARPLLIQPEMLCPGPDGVYDLHVGVARWETEAFGMTTRAYNGGVPGPTLLMVPGSIVRLRLHNQLEEEGEAGNLSLPDNTYRWPNTTNLHMHGMQVSPEGVADNVFRTLRPGEVALEYIYEVDADHPSGTFW